MDRDITDFHRSSTQPALASANEIRPIQNRLANHYGQRPSTPSRQSVQTVNLQSILKGAREVIIDFDGAAYRLRITRNHRLILTK